jgi:hypothetical protein
MSNSNLPTVQRLKYEDYADASDWKDAMQKLVNTLNLFITPAYNIFNGGVNYQNLTAPQIVDKQITGATTTTFSFVNPLAILPRAVLIGNCWSGIPSTHPAVALQIYWHNTQGTIVVDNIVGLTAGIVYNLSLVVL